MARMSRRTTIDAAALEAHTRWAKDRTGEGQLRLRGQSLAGDVHRAPRLRGATFTECDLSGVDFAQGNLEETSFVRCSAAGITLTRVLMTGASIEGGSFAGASLDAARMGGSSIRDVDFSGAAFPNAFWHGARVARTRFDGARFANAMLDSAIFEGCSFRGASFASERSTSGRSTKDATFQDCDFTGARFDDRFLSGARFLGCRIARARGKPANVDALVVDGCDVDRAAFLELLGWRDAVPGERRTFWVEGEVDCSDLKFASRVGVRLEMDRLPTPAEAERALRAPAAAAVTRAGGSEGTPFELRAITTTPE